MNICYILGDLFSRNLCSYSTLYISRNILYIRIYLLCISDPESYVVEAEEFSSNGLKNVNLASHIYNRT